MTHNKITDQEAFARQVREWQEAGATIVFSNGCFDLLHAGHTHYLEQAKTLGDKLVLGINTDRSVSALKGAERPVQDEQGRLQIMASLQCVDLVTLFDESTPLRLIELTNPDILVKGDDYTIDTIVGADFVMRNGGRVETIALLKGYSTTAIIDKIKNN